MQKKKISRRNGLILKRMTRIKTLKIKVLRMLKVAPMTSKAKISDFKFSFAIDFDDELLFLY